jgi:general secretion pathway protein N
VRRLAFARSDRAATRGEPAQGRSRGAARWGLAGATLGALAGTLAFAPAAWLARGVASATQQRLLLADARGTVWSGSAVAVLAGGQDSRDAAALPGRLRWQAAWRGSALELRASDDCCIDGSLTLRVQPGWSRLRLTLAPGAPSIGQWPAAWLAGLGTPWNTLQLGGAVRLASPGLAVESVAGRWRLDGRAEVELVGLSSRLSTLDALGSYRVTLSGDAAAGGPPRIDVVTLAGALRLSGSGTFGPGGLRFRGEARAGAGDETALANLLNIIGRRDGARSVISIG